MEGGGSLIDWVVGSVPGGGGGWRQMVGSGREQEGQLEEACREQGAAGVREVWQFVEGWSS